MTEILSESRKKLLIGLVLFIFMICDMILLENKSYLIFGILIFQFFWIRHNWEHVKPLMITFIKIALEPILNAFNVIRNMFGLKPIKIIAEKPKEEKPAGYGKWNVPVILSPESENKLDEYMKSYQLDYEPEVEKKVKAKDKKINESRLPDFEFTPPPPGPVGYIQPVFKAPLTISNHLVDSFTETIKSDNSKIDANNAIIKGDNNRIKGNNNKIKGDNNRIKGNNNKIKGDNLYVDGENNIVSGDNVVVIDRGGSKIIKGDNSTIKRF